MRTLKKSLALVLALVMVLGLGVVGASADNKLDDYTDAKDIGDAYVEAVGVMTGLEIVDGMTETTIDPTATYTREQAAKIIAYMVLGKTAADSLTCTVAPFDDVAADRWSAGYISFCVEQGIIDGMTDTTFEPTGTLTGFQWAKMLLSAVGFNANGEFTGDSWSLNTARVAHSVGLFAGDAAGADHVALQRQQAMLYAFNTLTVVKQVVWSEALGDYIYKYGEFADRYTGEGTLGQTVFGLDYVYGIINDNEGMGNKNTNLVYVTDSDGNTSGANKSVQVNADTGIDLMYHAVKVWYTGDKTKTGVYTMDLAKTTTADCTDVKNPDKLDTESKSVGVPGKRYEQALVDNRAYDNAPVEAYVVTYNYYLSTMGVRSNNLGKDDYTYIGSEKVDNDLIMTDVSEISRNSQIIVLKTTKDADAVYYVYAVGSTSGNVVDYNSNGTIELSDGTKLTPSALSTVTNTDVAELIAALRDEDHIAPNYYFVLDTHGHYISFSNSQYQTVAYYTDAWKVSNPGAWSTDVAYIAQFVDVATGEVEEIPVTADWHAWAKEGGYYDITDELYGDETYAPRAVFTNENTYGAYAYVASETFGTTTSKVGNYRYDYNNVEYIIVSGAGNNIKVDHYTGNEALINAYKDKYDDGVSTVKLSNIAVLTAAGTGTNSRYATVIFAYDGADTLAGGIAFFPKDVTDWGVHDNSFYNVMAYLNGAEVASKIDVVWKDTYIAAGFYSYTIDDATGKYTLTALDEGTSGIVLGTNAVENAGSLYWLHDGGDEFTLPSDTPVIDLRSENNRPSVIDDVSDLVNTNYTETERYALAYVVNVNDEVQYIYVVDTNTFTVNVKWHDAAAEAAWTNTKLAPETATFSVWASESNKVVTVTLTKTDNSNFGACTVPVYVDGVHNKTVTVDDTSGVITFDVVVTGACDITVGEYVPA